MPKQPNALWIDTNPSLERFHRSTIRYLSNQLTIAHWQYYQNPDEASSLAVPLTLLHDYLKSANKPIHLIGHSTGGLVGLLYARKHPERVKSLTLLGVGVNPSVDWQLQYYASRKILPCSREIVLAQMVKNLFGYQEKYRVKNLVEILEKDLDSSPSPHSLYQRVGIAPGGVSMPLMVCGSKDDAIVDDRALEGWQVWFKQGDRLWQCPQGYHFFHYFYPQQVGRQILKFWQSLANSSLEKTQDLEISSNKAPAVNC